METSMRNRDKVSISRDCLRDALEVSSSLTRQLNETGSRLGEINKNLPVLSNQLYLTYTRKCTLLEVRERVGLAFGPVSAVQKIYDTVHGLERSLRVGPTDGDIEGYLSQIKQLEGGLKFLTDNCGLAVQWMEDIVQLLDEDLGEDDKYILNVKRSFRVLKDLKTLETRAWLEGGVLTESFDKLGFEFRRQVEGCVSNRFSDDVIEKLHAILEKLDAYNRLENCKTIYADVRSSNARGALQALDLSYLEIEISEADSVQKFEDHIANWSVHLEFALRHILNVELELCKSVFDKIGSDVTFSCFMKIVIQSGFPKLLMFGHRVAKTKKDAIKLLKLLDIFAVLDKLRLDFNKLFGSKACLEIKSLTREVVKEVIEGACAIFKELQHQVELQRYNTIPSPKDVGVPRLVTFVTHYCIMLLEDDYRPRLSQVLLIHQTWNGSKSSNDKVLTRQLEKILEALEINLETWSKNCEDPAMSYFFLMNNCRFLFESLQGTYFGELIGATKYNAIEKNYEEAYLKESWGKLPQILSEDDLIIFASRRTATQELVKKRLREFNDVFEDMYMKQSEWVLPDNRLREKACQLIVQKVIPNYRYFLHNYGYLVDNGLNPGKYVKYSVITLDSMIRALFQPNMTKFGRSDSVKSTGLMGKLRNTVSNQFRVVPIPT